MNTRHANVFLIGPPGAGDRNWVLVDAGLAGWADSIASAVGKMLVTPMN
jgi:hypothetical protein